MRVEQSPGQLRGSVMERSAAPYHGVRFRALPRGLLVGLALSLLVGSSTLSAAPRRSIAVLEFRQDVEALPRLADRVAARLKALTGLRVLGPVDARQRIGSLVDSFVARCQGEPRCVGAIGNRLGVTEVLLIGMSSLGDVILQISRIDAQSRKVRSSVAHTMPPEGAVPAETLDNWIRRLLPSGDFMRYGYIKVHSNHPGAEVFLNSALRGTTPLPGPIKVQAPSTHDIKVTKPGYVDFSAQVEVPPDATLQVNAALTPIPHSPVPYYRSWWFWTALVAGVAVVAGVTAGVTLSLRPDDNTVPAVVRW